MVGFTVTAVYTLQLLTLNGEQFIIARLIDTLIGCLIAFGGMVWLWPQWQSGLLKKNAHDALEADQQAIRLILSADPKAPRAGLSTHARQPGAQRAPTTP
ncbi:YccS/YhfK family integral membrane protein [Klebsiella pneumoniae]|uniref:YccS/YhfK family integral membrane protein n=1 Tax=Klebsiella pneumoniae TaxID=573 RepID=A0A2X3GH85_KLEPN|nr:YccS/YhfK family integral membrane protein [Klebsiella pneumoniae]